MGDTPSADSLASLLQSRAVPMEVLHRQYGPLMELVRTLIGVVPRRCGWTSAGNAGCQAGGAGQEQGSVRVPGALQRNGGILAESKPVIGGETTELREAPTGRDRRDRITGASALQIMAHGLHASLTHMLHRRESAETPEVVEEATR
jgi:hypothetical protein